MCKFEFDNKKSRSNLDKHGIDFEQAQTLWNDPELIEIQAKCEDEPRSLVIGQMLGKHWSAVITYRDGVIRIISVQRSRKKKVAIYES